MEEYIKTCLRIAWRHSWERSQSVTAVLWVGINAAAWKWPGLVSYATGGKITEINDWALAAILFGGIILLRLLMAPYWAWKEMRDERDSVSAKLKERKGAIVVKKGSGFSPFGGSVVSFIFKNIGDAPATDINVITLVHWENKFTRYQSAPAENLREGTDSALPCKIKQEMLDNLQHPICFWINYSYTDSASGERRQTDVFEEWSGDKDDDSVSMMSMIDKDELLKRVAGTHFPELKPPSSLIRNKEESPPPPVS